MKVRPVDSPEEEKLGKKRYIFFCPGCKCGHAFRTGPGEWTYDGNADKPTIHPSVLLTAPGDESYRCHSFVRSGMIEFLSDCNHALKGQTVPLEDF